MTLEIKDLSFNYRDKQVLRSINLSVKEGEMISLLGKNGAGKTTLLRLIPGFLRSDSGSITIDKRPVGPLEERESL